MIRLSNISDNRKAFILFMLSFFWLLFGSILIQLFIYLLPKSKFGLILPDGIENQVTVMKMFELEENNKCYNFASCFSMRMLMYTIYSLTGINEPMIILPILAFLHGLSTIVLFKIIKIVIKNDMAAFIGSLFFSISPSLLFWSAQLKKENFYILGIFVYVLVWIKIIRYNKISLTSLFILFPISLILMQFTRDLIFNQFVPIWQAIAIGIILLKYFFMRNKVNKKVLVKSFMVSLVIIYSLFIQIKVIAIFKDILNEKLEQYKGHSIMRMDEEQFDTQRFDTKQFAVREELGEFFMTKLRQVAKQRINFLSAGGESLIDENIVFKNSRELLFYIPRALQIAFFAPFPNMILSETSNTSQKLFRLLYFIELFPFYILLPYSFFLLIQKKDFNVEFAFIFFIILSIMLVFGLTVVNIGTLVRVRLPFHAVLYVTCLSLIAKQHLTEQEKKEP